MKRKSLARLFGPTRSSLIVIVAAFLAWAGIAEYAGAEAPKKSKSAVDRVLAVYVPQSQSDLRVFLPQFGATFAPGKALEDAAVDVGNVFFRSASPFSAAAETPFNVLLVLHAKWDSKDGNTVLTVKFKVLDASGATLAEGEKNNDMSTPKLMLNNAFYALSVGVMKDILSDDDLLGKFSEAGAHSANSTSATFDRSLIVSREKPVKSGTGFFINDQGQVMTAAHVVHDCPVAEIKVDGKAVAAKVVAESLLLDLAVIDSGMHPVHVIPLRAGTSFDLGESVTNIGFPLDGVLAGSPNVTRGNVSSRGALAGSLGQFQFSAPVQPGSSGGPVVSEAGELLGVTVGTLSVAGLIQKGVLPQNVNFALDARYVATFMDRYKVSYVSVTPNNKPDARSPTDLTLPAVVQLLCYQ